MKTPIKISRPRHLYCPFCNKYSMTLRESYKFVYYGGGKTAHYKCLKKHEETVNNGTGKN